MRWDSIHSDTSNLLRWSHYSSVRLWLQQIGLPFGYSDSIVTEVPAHAAIAANYLQCTLKGTPTCKSYHIGTDVKPTLVGQEESGRVGYLRSVPTTPSSTKFAMFIQRFGVAWKLNSFHLEMWWCCGDMRQKVIDISAPQRNCGVVWTDPFCAIWLCKTYTRLIM